MNVLKECIGDYCPDELVCDFEQAFIREFQKLFSSTHIKGCHFHFGQCVFRSVQRLAYQNLYAENFDFISFVKLLIGHLCFYHILMILTRN